jgi:hypothetical protein
MSLEIPTLPLFCSRAAPPLQPRAPAPRRAAPTPARRPHAARAARLRSARAALRCVRPSGAVRALLRCVAQATWSAARRWRMQTLAPPAESSGGSTTTFDTGKDHPSLTAIAQSPACCRSRTRTKSPRPGSGESAREVEPPCGPRAPRAGDPRFRAGRMAAPTQKARPSRHSQVSKHRQEQHVGTPTPTTSALPRPPSREATARA